MVPISTYSLRGAFPMPYVILPSYYYYYFFFKKNWGGGKWRRIYGPVVHPPSFHALEELTFDAPLRLLPGDVYGIYVHSEEPVANLTIPSVLR